MVNKKQKMKQIAGKLYMAVVFVFLYAPILTLIILSFNESRFRGNWSGFSLKWYRSLFQDKDILHALFTTLILALLSAFIATVFGTIVAFALNRMKKLPKTLLMAVTNIPMLNADIVTGISLMLLFLAVNYAMGFYSVLLAHITFNLPYVILSVLPRLRQLNMSTYEAALDLGASKPYAFWKVILPDILPSAMTGFLLAFTMSLDDFVITHFTKGVGVETLSSMIYTEQKKGIRPEIYALSTIMFLTVTVVLIFYNRKKSAKPVLAETPKWKKVCRYVGYACIPAAVIFAFVGYNSTKTTNSEKLYIYNWGEYMEPDVIAQFEEETGIEVIYDEFETNETMYPIVAKGAASYDLVCPSDYMVERMAGEGLLEEINWENIPNTKYIDEEYWEFASAYDEGNKYSMPYLWGTVGILYNKSMVDEEIDSWSVLWDEKYQDNILMQKSVRDSFGVALKYMGCSLNSTDEAELDEAKELLLKQKRSGVVQAYVVDEVRDKMIAGEAAIGIIYCGEALVCQEENPDLEYVIPKEGSNVWLDSWVIPKEAKNKENAEKFLNFICRPEIMKANFDYITYPIPSSAGKSLLDKKYRENETVFPEVDSLTNCEVFRYLGSEVDVLYNSRWKELMSE